jgi:hypothetical protein
LTTARRLGSIDQSGCSSYYRRVSLAALPPRSMVGQLPLEQHIGVRIPGGQPIVHFPVFPNFLIQSDTSLNQWFKRDLRSRWFEQVRLQSFKKWGTDWGTIPPESGEGIKFTVEARKMPLSDVAVRATRPRERAYKVHAATDSSFLSIRVDPDCGAGAIVSIYCPKSRSRLRGI